MILRPRPAGKSPHGRPPKPLSRQQQANLAVKVVAVFIFLAVVLVVAFIPHGGNVALGGRGTLEKHTMASPHEAHAAAGTTATTAAGEGPRAKVEEAKHGQPEHEKPKLLFEGVELLDTEGNLVKDPTKALEGRAVGLLFGAMWCPVCQAFFPRLQEWMREAGRPMDIAIVYVSSDADEAAAASSQSEHGWDFAVPFENEALRSALKAQYKVWAMREGSVFGANRSTGIPTVVAVDPKGHVLAHMDADREGMEALEQWRYKEWTW